MMASSPPDKNHYSHGHAGYGVPHHPGAPPNTAPNGQWATSPHNGMNGMSNMNNMNSMNSSANNATMTTPDDKMNTPGTGPNDGSKNSRPNEATSPSHTQPNPNNNMYQSSYPPHPSHHPRGHGPPPHHAHGHGPPPPGYHPPGPYSYPPNVSAYGYPPHGYPPYHPPPPYGSPHHPPHAQHGHAPPPHGYGMPPYGAVPPNTPGTPGQMSKSGNSTAGSSTGNGNGTGTSTSSHKSPHAASNSNGPSAVPRTNTTPEKKSPSNNLANAMDSSPSRTQPEATSTAVATPNSQSTLAKEDATLTPNNNNNSAKTPPKSSNTTPTNTHTHRTNTSNANNEEEDELVGSNVAPMRSDFHFYALDRKKKFYTHASSMVKESMAHLADPQAADSTTANGKSKSSSIPSTPAMILTALNERLMQTWEAERPPIRSLYMSKEEEDRRRYIAEDEVASRHCATLTARAKSPKIPGNKLLLRTAEDEVVVSGVVDSKESDGGTGAGVGADAEASTAGAGGMMSTSLDGTSGITGSESSAVNSLNALRHSPMPPTQLKEEGPSTTSATEAGAETAQLSGTKRVSDVDASNATSDDLNPLSPAKKQKEEPANDTTMADTDEKDLGAEPTADATAATTATTARNDMMDEEVVASV